MKLHVKRASFSTDWTAKHQDFPFFNLSLTINFFIPKYPDNAHTDSVLTSRTSRRLLEQKAPENDFPVRNNAASIMGNSVISLQRQLRYVNATLIMTNFYLYLIHLWWQFFQLFVYGDIRSLCSNLAGIDPEKLYRATFICQYGLCCCIVWPSFLFDCFVKIWATRKNFLGKWFTAPPPLAENCPYAYVVAWWLSIIIYHWSETWSKVSIA